MFRLIVFLLSIITICQTMQLFAIDRIAPKEGTIDDYTIKFNGGYIKAQCLFMDLRTNEEKSRDTAAGKLAGPVILYLHGHSQRPGDGFVFTSELCINAKSGIIIVPVSDTPYGRDPKWRGDDGKDVVLMELARFVLQKNGLITDSYRPITAMKAVISTCNSRQLPTGEEQKTTIPVNLMAVGWSHGAILARRIASRYHELVTDLVQVTPAGYEQWGNNSCIRTGCLMTAFNWESMRIGTGIFRGEARQVFNAGFGVAKGQVGDTYRSCGSCIYGNFHPFMPFRIFRDTWECAGYLDDSSFPVSHLKNIVVLFGKSDSLFEYRNAGILNPDNPGPNETAVFTDKYYRSAEKNGAKIVVKVLPGNHIAPLVYSQQYVREALINTGQLRDH